MANTEIEFVWVGVLCQIINHRPFVEQTVHLKSFTKTSDLV